MNSPLFIIGCHRSGTTLLASLLRPSGYGAPIETHFITKYYKKLASYGDIKVKGNFIKLVKEVLKERPVMQWNLNIDAGEFYNEFNEISYRDIVSKLCMLRAGQKGLKSWGDKTPDYTLEMENIYELFPESKYIYIVRDGRDVALSLLAREWGPKNMLSCAEYWKAYNKDKEILHILKENRQIYFLKYEDLIDNAERIMPDIYKFLDEEYNEGKMKELIGRIRKGNYNKWKKKMNARQVKVFESVAAGTLRRFGYETSHDETDINQFAVFIYRLQEAIMKVKYLFKINVIDGIKIKFFGKEPFAD